ncbi:SLC13 family permease [Niallia endozanthoxylica]|nr:SLC13 family permease [Niallia endozanthoxylica]
MTIKVIAILGLLVIFILGTILPINIGVLGLVAAFIVGFFMYDLSLHEMIQVFPVQLFLIIVGITYLFTIIQSSGAIDLLAEAGLKWVKGQVGFIPWLMFVLSFALACVGTFGIAVVTLLAPIALRLAYKTNISQLMMSMMIIMGIQAGSFSPLNLFGAIVNGVMKTGGYEYSPALLLLNCFIYFSIVSFITFSLFGGLRLFKRDSMALVYEAGALEAASIESRIENQRAGFNFYKGICLISIPILGILSFGFGMNLGVAAIIVGLVITLIAPHQQAGVLRRMPWRITLLVTGIVTYVGVMEKAGVMDDVAVMIENIGNPALAALALSYVSGVISSFASTTGFLASIIPMAESVLLNPHLSTNNVIAVISVSSSIVDLSPLSSVGAILLANVQGIKERVFFKQLLMTTGILIALGPGLAWLLFIVVGMPW